MKDNKDLDFLKEIAKKISDRSKLDSPITPEEVFDLFKEILESITTVKTIEVPVFLPVIIEQEEDGFYTARTYGFPRCKGLGRTEEEAVQQFKEEIDRYHKSFSSIEKKMRVEEIIKNLFPKDYF